MSAAELTQEQFERCPIWKWDDAMEGYLPVAHSDPLPKDQGTLFIRARFAAASGEQFTGYLVGLGSFYAAGLFVKDEEFILNLNLPDLMEADVARIKELLDNPALRMFPLKYQDDIGFQHSPPLIGVLEP